VVVWGADAVDGSLYRGWMSQRRDRVRAGFAAIRRVLMELWDPIGVREEPEVQDEYDTYVPVIYRLLVTNRPKHELVDYLWWVETERMGLCGDRQATEVVAEYLLGLREEL
jgi:hypothetical protein